MNLKPFFEPESIAVIGTSLTNNRHPANVIYTKNRLRYPVKVFPVNPRGGALHGDKVYCSVSEIPEKIDLAVIAVRADLVPKVFEDCIRSGVSAVTVISGGFAESGRNDLQARLLELAVDSGIPFVGPNCLGSYTPGRVDSFFLPGERMVHPASGDVAVVSQSGGILVDLLIKFADEGLGLSRAISIGNKAMVREVHLLDYLSNDPKTRVIAFYVEGFGKNEGREFIKAAADCPKPVIVLKAGKSPGGQRAVSSHTASLAGDYAVFSGILAQHGVVEAENEFELVSFCESLSCYQRSIHMLGRIGIITGSGGHGALAVDACMAHGLSVSQLPDQLQQKVKNSLSPSVRPIAAVANPIDLTGSATDDDFIATAEALAQHEEIDCILLLLLPYLPGITVDLGARLSQIPMQFGKPVIAYVPHIEKYRMLTEGFELNRVPVSSSIAGAVLMAEALRRCNPC